MSAPEGHEVSPEKELAKLPKLFASLDDAYKEVVKNRNIGRAKRNVRLLTRVTRDVRELGGTPQQIQTLQEYRKRFLSFITTTTRESLESSLTLTTEKISRSSALDLITEKNPDLRKIYKVNGAQAPRIRHAYEGKKEYVILHGSASDDRSLVNAGYDRADFAYAVLRNGVILQFFDDDLGQGAGGGAAMLNGDPFTNLKAIAVEISSPEHSSIQYEVQDPTKLQKKSVKRLLAYLKSKHRISGQNVTLSSQVVTENDGQLIQWSESPVHGDTKTWRNRPDLLTELGINPEEFATQNRVPNFPNAQARNDFLALVKKRQELAKRQAREYTRYASATQNTAGYWEKFLAKYQK